MTQITIRGLDDRLHRLLKAEAQRRGLSMNRYLLQILQKTTGLQTGESTHQQTYHDLDHLAGTWSKEEAACFDEQLAIQRGIDEALWS